MLINFREQKNNEIFLEKLQTEKVCIRLKDFLSKREISSYVKSFSST